MLCHHVGSKSDKFRAREIPTVHMVTKILLFLNYYLCNSIGVFIYSWDKNYPFYFSYSYFFELKILLHRAYENAAAILVPVATTDFPILSEAPHDSVLDVVFTLGSCEPTRIRKSCRTSKPPSWLNDYVHKRCKLIAHVVVGTTYPLSTYMSYASPSNPYYKVIHKISFVRELNTYEEVLHDPHWVATMQ